MKGPYGQMNCYLDKQVRIRWNTPIEGKVIAIENVYNTINGYGDSCKYDVAIEVDGENRWFEVSPRELEFANKNEIKLFGYRD